MNNTNNGNQQQNSATASNQMVNSYDAANSQSPSQSMQSSAQPAQAANAQSQASGNGQAKAIVGIFRDLTSAEQSVTQLRNSGFTTEEINIVSKDTNAGNGNNNDSVMDGTMTGGAIGGIGGLLLSAGALTIPGLGPIMAAGPIAATIAGAIGGGITGGLIDWGIPSEKSEEYNEQVSSGNTLAVIKSSQDKVAQAVQILTANGAMNVETHNAK